MLPSRFSIKHTLLRYIFYAYFFYVIVTYLLCILRSLKYKELITRYVYYYKFFMVRTYRNNTMLQ